MDEFLKFMLSEQSAIAFLGVTAIALSQSNNFYTRRWASVFGILSQPFWFYMAWRQGAWGVFFLSILYTVVWVKGFHTYWLKG